MATPVSFRLRIDSRDGSQMSAGSGRTSQNGRRKDEQSDAVMAKTLRRSLMVFAALSAMGATCWWCLRPKSVPQVLPAAQALPAARTAPTQRLPAIPWTDVTASAGIQFRHVNGASGEKLLPETMGSGCAFFDYDGDGDQDLIFVNSQAWPWNGGSPSRPALYENDGHGQFSDVTERVGLTDSLYGMGAACGDYDNDGRVDLFLSGVGASRLYHNLGGRFEDVTKFAGVGGALQDWSTCCGWLDYDRDGDLDLFVGRYIKWSRELDLAQDFRLVGGQRAYGRPQGFEGAFPSLYRNNGDGRFTDVAEAAGLTMKDRTTGVPFAKSLGVTFGDLDQDGWLEILVANDTVQNLLFWNRGNGTFDEIGAISGIAFDAKGQARGAMGIDLADFRNNGTLGVAIGNFANEMAALYVAPHSQLAFTDEAVSSGLGKTTRLVLTFGVLFLDADLDRRLDLFAVNGHLENEIHRVQASQYYKQPPQLYWNCGADAATEFALLQEEQVGPDLVRPLVGRGAASADIDGDGDLDLVITSVGGPPRLLRNDQQTSHHWLRLRLVGRQVNRDGIGARVVLTLPNGTSLTRQVMPTRSYLSQCELPVTFGLGEISQISRLTVVWPDGSRQVLSTTEIDRETTIEQPTK
jgi:enediyne biosynthesis protein E4